jgi:hypothetical protein
VTFAGERIAAGHTPHGELRAGRTGAFSHWGDALYLALPAGLANGPQMTITADYTLQPRPWVARTLLFAVVTLAALRFRFAFGEDRRQGFARRLAGIRRVSSATGIILACLALTIYAVTILYGWIAGYALPTVALFDIFPPIRRLALWEPNAPNALYALAGAGAVTEWLIRLLGARLEIEKSEPGGTMRGVRPALLFGAVFLILLFVMSNGGWRGVMTAADMNYMSLAGLLPHSDAATYFFTATDLSVDGRWNPVASQRPIAAAIRTGIVAVGGTYVASLVLQCALLAICSSIAILGVAEILGGWSAMAFGGLLLGLERPYVTTTMTETLGLGAAVLSAPFLLRGLRDHSYQSALAAFGLVATALLIRMGSMFTLPFLAAWVVFLGVREGVGRAALGGVALIASGLWFGQWALLRLFGDASLGVGSDFSYVFCGLATGTDWYHCFQSEAARGNIWTRPTDAILYEKAWLAFLADPKVMAGSLIRNGASYASDLPNLLFRQYASVASIPTEWIALGVAAPLLVVAARIRTPFFAEALGFFVLVFLTTLVSATLIFAADGRRVMIVTNVLLSLGLAFGFALPAAPRPAAPAAASQSPVYVIPVVLLLLFGLPALVKARVLYRIAVPDYIADTQRIAAPPVTPAILVQQSDTAHRSLLVVPPELLLQIGHSVSFDPDFTQALDFAAANAPGSLLTRLAQRSFAGGSLTEILFGGPELLNQRGADLRIKLTEVSARFFRIDHWWPDPAGDGDR